MICLSNLGESLKDLDFRLATREMQTMIVTTMTVTVNRATGDAVAMSTVLIPAVLFSWTGKVVVSDAVGCVDVGYTVVFDDVPIQ